MFAALYFGETLADRVDDEIYELSGRAKDMGSTAVFITITIKVLNLKYFRAISLLEGLSYLLILSVTFNVISRDYVFTLGITHGVLFLAYLMLSLQASHQRGWSVFVWLLVFLASIVPFAFIVVEFFLRKELEKTE